MQEVDCISAGREGCNPGRKIGEGTGGGVNENWLWFITILLWRKVDEHFPSRMRNILICKGRKAYHPCSAIDINPQDGLGSRRAFAPLQSSTASVRLLIVFVDPQASSGGTNIYTTHTA
jgi:hypothetical protein